jgi:hypothetical protein
MGTGCCGIGSGYGSAALVPIRLMAGTEAEGAETGLPMGGASWEAIGTWFDGGGSGAIWASGPRIAPWPRRSRG